MNKLDEIDILDSDRRAVIARNLPILEEKLAKLKAKLPFKATEGDPTSIAQKHQLERDITKVEVALNLMDLEVYGLCQDCGEQISVARLTAIPEATNCVGCEELRENA